MTPAPSPATRVVVATATSITLTFGLVGVALPTSAEAAVPASPHVAVRAGGVGSAPSHQTHSTATSRAKASGTRYVRVNRLNIRASSAARSTVVGTVARGTVLQITGAVKNRRSQVIFNGSRRWAYSDYLSKTDPGAASTPPSDGGSLGSESLDRTNAYAKAIVRAIRADFPQITTIYGWRASSAYSSDHPSGRAIDIMIPNWSTPPGTQLGDAIALYLQQRHTTLRIRYLIWRQRNWNVERDAAVTAWRPMADRGSPTQNHLDHVHVSVYDVG